jgi:hypothetical protein
MIRQNAATYIALSSGFSCSVSRLAWIPDALQTQVVRPELEPARLAELPQPAHKARAPNTEQFTACTLRIAPNDSEAFIVLHVYLHPVERIQRRAVRPGSLSGHGDPSLDSFRLRCRRIRLREGWFLGGGRFPLRVLPQSNRTSCALLARRFSENEALIVDLLDWKKF